MRLKERKENPLSKDANETAVTILKSFQIRRNFHLSKACGQTKKSIIALRNWTFLLKSAETDAFKLINKFMEWLYKFSFFA